MFDITRRNNNNRNVARYNPYREMEEFERNFFSDPFGSSSTTAILPNSKPM